MRSLFFALVAAAFAASAAPKKLVIIGDSLTEGYGVARTAAYPALLEKEIEKSGKSWKVVNAGISGSTSASALSQVQWHMKQKPDLMIIALGANDGLRGTSVKTMEDNIDKALTEVKKGGVKVILIGMRVPPNYGKKYSDDFAAVFPRLAKKHDVPLVPFLLEKVGGRAELNLSDGIHPNEKGHALISTMVYDAIKKYL